MPHFGDRKLECALWLQALTAEVLLSGREKAILRQVVRSVPNKEIASHLGIGEAAVRAHQRQLYRKLGVKDRSQARMWAGDNGIN